jgi:hypothetical protein
VTLGEQLAHAIAKKDRTVIARLLTEDVDFKGLTPGRFWEGSTPDDVLDVLFANWFEDHDVIESLAVLAQGDDVGDTHHVAYRLELSTPDGPRVAEQQAYYRTDDDQVSFLRVLCSGFRPRT